MTADATYVIVGAGQAGAMATQTLREEGFDGPITLIGQEPERPYERPPLSKGYLMDTMEREKIFVHPAGWYAAHDIDLRLGTTVERIDPAGHEVTLAGGATLRYAKLLLTTGSTPRRLPVPGADLDGVLYLRKVGDSDRLREVLRSASRIAVLGGGWVGLEVTAAARTAGVEVTLLEVADLPLLRVLGPEAAAIFARLHRDHDVDLRCGVQVAELTGEGGRVTGVRLAGGDHIPVDAVVVGVGISPDTRLAEAAGLTVGDGVVVDSSLRSSHPDIYAAGDVANARHPHLGKHIRVEHWANARDQPWVAARMMLGLHEVYERLPYFFTDQYDLGMEYTGYAEPGDYDQVIFRGDVDRREFIAFWLAGGRVLAGMNVNVWDVADHIQALVRAGKPIDPDRLADPGEPLEALIDQ